LDLGCGQEVGMRCSWTAVEWVGAGEWIIKY
jgi:hypothetical protein